VKEVGCNWVEVLCGPLFPTPQRGGGISPCCDADVDLSASSRPLRALTLFADWLYDANALKNPILVRTEASFGA
jgi:hypothetical protein